jgi:hypothetical protein
MLEEPRYGRFSAKTRLCRQAVAHLVLEAGKSCPLRPLDTQQASLWYCIPFCCANR